jgi:hypothetical protein
VTPPATHAARPALRAGTGQRRVSGPAKGRGARAASARGATARAAAARAPQARGGLLAPRPALAGGPRGAALGSRLARRAVTLHDAPVLDRLIRGRAWIPIVAVGLMGLVFLQVSLLKLNTGIGRAVQSAGTLERQNAGLRGQVSLMDSGQRVQDVAAERGMVLPAAGQVHYLHAGKASAAGAAQAVTAPDPVAQQPVGAAASSTAAGGIVTGKPEPAGAAATAPVQTPAATGGAATPTTTPGAATGSPAPATSTATPGGTATSGGATAQTQTQTQSPAPAQSQAPSSTGTAGTLAGGAPALNNGG